jgi:hypothetical protein
MALINCPECGTEVSSQAAVCVKCGYPLEAARARAGESAASATSGKENGALWEVRFEKLKMNKLSALGGGIGLVVAAFVACGLVLSAGIIGRIVGVVVLIGCLTTAVVLILFRWRNDPLVVGEDYVAFEGKKIYARDVVTVEVKEDRDSVRDQYYPLFISTNHGVEIINLLGYGIEPDGVGEVAGIIAKRLKTSAKPRKD